MIENKYYAVGIRCSYGYREYKSESDDYKNDVLSFVFIYIGNKVDRLKYSNDDKEKFMKLSSNKKKNDDSLELATFYLGKKFLAIESENVIESLGIDELEESIEMNKENHFKGMVLHKNRLISVLDIRDFINEDISNDDVNTIVLFEYDKNNKTHCVGILVSSLESISIVDRSKIQNIESHFLGSGTLIKSLVDINDYDNSKMAMLLDIKKIDENLTENL